MEINKISSSTPDKYSVGNFLKYYRLADEHIVLIDNSYGEAFPINTDYEAINNHIFDTWNTICCYNVEDRGDCWEFIEIDEENCKYDYEPDDEDYAEELKLAKLDEIHRIEELIIEVIDTKQPQFFDDTELCELDIEYNEENVAVVYKFENKPVKYFPIKEGYNSLLIKGERNYIIYPIAEQIYNYYYGVEEDYAELKVDRYNEINRIEELIAKAIDDKEPQPFDKSDAYEIDIEYMEEENHNLFEAAVVLKYCNNPERYFPLKDIYNNISTVLKGEEDDILYHIAQEIYTYYYGEEE